MRAAVGLAALLAVCLSLRSAHAKPCTQASEAADCTGHGKCVAGVCQCWEFQSAEKPGYCGESCNVKATGPKPGGCAGAAAGGGGVVADTPPVEDSNPMTCELQTEENSVLTCSTRCMCAKQLWVFYYYHPMYAGGSIEYICEYWLSTNLISAPCLTKCKTSVYMLMGSTYNPYAWEQYAAMCAAGSTPTGNVIPSPVALLEEKASVGALRAASRATSRVHAALQAAAAEKATVAEVAKFAAQVTAANDVWAAHGDAADATLRRSGLEVPPAELVPAEWLRGPLVNSNAAVRLQASREQAAEALAH